NVPHRSRGLGHPPERGRSPGGAFRKAVGRLCRLSWDSLFVQSAIGRVRILANQEVRQAQVRWVGLIFVPEKVLPESSVNGSSRPHQETHGFVSQRWIAAESLPRRQQSEDFSLSVVVVLAIWVACSCHRPTGCSSPVFLLRLRW